MIEEAPHGRVVGDLPEQVQSTDQGLVGVAEQQRLDLPQPRNRGPAHDSSCRGGNSPSGRPLPSQLNRFTTVSPVCRSRSMWKFSTAIGAGPPEDSPNGPEPPMPGPPS